MARNTVFDKGRDEWRVEDDEYRQLRLGPSRGATPGEYQAYNAGELSDSYYGPGDDYSRRNVPSSGYNRGDEDPWPRGNPPSAAPAGRFPGERSSNRSYGEVHSYGLLHAGQRSWADLGVSSVHAGESGVTDEPLRSHRGRGPKGYRRSDERLMEIICERLTDDPHVDASDIEVQVSDGIVTLSGHVSDRRAKWRVEEIVDACGGVEDVDNRLRIEGKATP